jgi:tryptophan synthase alpha chain
MLETTIRAQAKSKDILLMTHIVIGYPSLEDSYQLVKTMVEAGVELMELQIPFSEPIADGPVILRANQEALATGITVEQCLDFAERVAREFNIPFLFMTYYNILFKYGVAKFATAMAERGLKGAIVPDLPPEEAGEYLRAMAANGLDPIFIFAPNSPDYRLKLIAENAGGFVYCVARKGVTGAHTEFSRDLDAYLDRCRAATALPLALGFGVSSKEDVEFLKGKADIAVVGSQAIRVFDRDGVEAVGTFLKGLR